MFSAFLLILCSSIFLISPMSSVFSATSVKFPILPSFVDSEQIITPILPICLEIWLTLLSLSAVKSMRKKPNTWFTILQASNFLSRKTTLNSLKLNLMRLKNFPALKKTTLIPAPMPLLIPDFLIPPLPTLRPNNGISTDTSVMPSSLEYLPMDWVFQDLFPSLIKILNQHILKQL